ncbi:MAG TPA: hypothetical protein VED83_02485 [Burkholderiaceae bacterium]|nr:hypothetical protein [Burkholderiaceae bacterium]HYB50883.1 hypothetical protein [Burkholderiaceae bacterium]
MDKSDEQRELEATRQIVQIRALMNRHDVTFEQAAAVLELCALQELLDTARRQPR